MGPRAGFYWMSNSMSMTRILGKWWPWQGDSCPELYVHSLKQAHDSWVVPFCYATPSNVTVGCGLLQWRRNERDGVSNHQPYDCLLNRLFRRGSKKTSKLRVTGLCEGNSPVTGEFPAQRPSNAENVSIWWRHHGECRAGVYWIRPVRPSVVRLPSVRYSIVRFQKCLACVLHG